MLRNLVVKVHDRLGSRNC